jgi:hypothetical protein
MRFLSAYELHRLRMEASTYDTLSQHIYVHTAYTNGINRMRVKGAFVQTHTT